jgi:hypothetical protein
MERRVPRRTGRWMVAVSLALFGLVVGCGDDDAEDGTGASDDDVEEVAESAGARGVAEAIRVALVAEDLGEGEHARDVAVLQEAVGDIPGEPDVTGIEDADGDGRDDDGNVEVRVDREVACLSVGSSGEVDVTGGEC